MRVRRWSLARQLFVLQAVIVLAVVLCGAVLDYVHTRHRTEDNARHEVTELALTIAGSPSVLAALATPDPSAQLQPYAEQVRTDAGVDFITIMDPYGIRYTHPNPAEIGQHYLGHIDPALAGQTFTETYTGTLGPSVRAITPVTDASGTVRALVSVGITVAAIDGELSGQLAWLAAIAALALLIGGVATYVVTVRLRRRTRGLSGPELTRLLEYHEATLHAVREGLLMLDADGVVYLANDGARELLGMSDDPAGKSPAELGLPELPVDREVHDELWLTDDRALVLNSSPVRRAGRLLGSVVTLRDHTDLQQLTGELNSVRGLTESLRSQAHEAANRLHTVVSLVELGRPGQAIEFATTELKQAQRLTDTVVGAVGEPVLAALLLGKAAQASERGVDLEVTPESRIDDGTLSGVDQHDLVTVLGNLLDNGIDAAAAGEASPPWVRVGVTADDRTLLLRVSDSGPGIAPSDVDSAFRRGWSTKAGDGRGLGLALVGQAVRRGGGTVEVSGATFTVRIPLAER